MMPFRFDRIDSSTQFSRLQSVTGTFERSKMRATHTKMGNWEANCTSNWNSRAIRRILSTGVIGLFLSTAQAYSVDELLPPFGFRWNDSMAHVEAVLHGAKAKITSREKKENRNVWTVEGLLHPGLKRTLFTFSSLRRPDRLSGLPPNEPRSCSCQPLTLPNPPVPASSAFWGSLGPTRRPV